METELSDICRELDVALIRTLDSWREALCDSEETTGDAVSLYCLFPRLASQMAWTRGSLQGAELSLKQLHGRKDLSDPAAVTMLAGGHGCCPCCGGGGPSLMQQAPCTCEEPEEEEHIHSETRIIKETVIEGRTDGRGEKGGRGSRKA